MEKSLKRRKKSEPVLQKKPKIRKYDPDYLKYGFAQAEGEKIKKLEEDVQRMCRILRTSDEPSGKEKLQQHRPSRIPLSLSVIEKKREEKARRENARRENLKACDKSLNGAQRDPKRRMSRIPLPVSVIETRRAERESNRKNFQKVALGQGIEHFPKPPCSPPPAQASFRQKRAARLSSVQIKSSQTPQPPCQPKPGRQRQVNLRPLQVRETCSDLFDSQSLVNAGFRFPRLYKPLPPIGSPPQDMTGKEHLIRCPELGCGEQMLGSSSKKQKVQTKYNYLGRFEKDPKADIGRQRELKAPRNVSEKPSPKKVLVKRRQKYNYLGRFKKEEVDESGSLTAGTTESRSSCDADCGEESRSVNARPRFAGTVQPVCGTCGRRFAEHRLEAHATICSRLHGKKRSLFDSSKHRVKGTDLERYVSTDQRAGITMSKSKTIKTSEYVTCPHCCCRMPPRVAQIHIHKCATIRNKLH